MSKKDAVTCQHFIFLWPRFLLQRTVMAGKGWSPTTNQHTAFAFSSLPASSLSHLLHPQPHPIKGLCVVPPAPIEVGTTNYPFIPAVVPSAQHRSPCPPLHSPSSMLKKIYFFFSPHEKQSTFSDFHPSPFFALPWYIACSYRKTLTMKEISGGGEDNTGASIHPDSCSCSHKQPIKILFSPSPFTC